MITAIRSKVLVISIDVWVQVKLKQVGSYVTCIRCNAWEDGRTHFCYAPCSIRCITVGSTGWIVIALLQIMHVYVIYGETMEGERPLNLKWRKINNTTGPTPQSRHGHKAVAIKELVIIFGGGNDGIMDTLHVLNTGNKMADTRDVAMFVRCFCFSNKPVVCTSSEGGKT